MPTNEALYDEAIGLHERGDVAGAVGKLDELLKQDASYALAHAALSVFYSKAEDYDKAIAHADKVCEMEPEDPFSFIAKSLVCQKAGRIPEAEQAMMQARQVQAAAHFRQEEKKDEG
jgi:tetratricopeptide (TPR) repeat protein